ncbi:Alanine--tRNA ligase [Gossypium arboreum]|uniref:Alanine--tRNA ligase n=1 Tax=Gossypium arboreum TaxID=29729 RepID=A0A0B0N5N9_GOSAR|nr:Alanine--tRNA ligase [Gossypium arboreum]
MMIVKASLDSGIVRSIRCIEMVYFGSYECLWKRWQIGFTNGLFFVQTGRDTGVCLIRVRHTIMLHGRVSPGVGLRIKSVYPIGLTQPRHTDVSTGRVYYKGLHTGV